MKKATKKTMQVVLRQLRFATMSTEELVDRIEAAEEERIANNRKKLNDLDHESRYKRPKSGDHEKFTR